ncbi:MAG: ATP-binding protein, partial [Pseudomonadota bacterium]
ARRTTVKLDELSAIITNARTLSLALNLDRGFIVLRDDKEPDTLMGGATREVTLEHRGENGRGLSELLRLGPLTASPRTAWEKEAMGLRLQWEQAQGILARTARKKKSFKISSQERPALNDPYLPDQFGRRSFVTMPILAKGKIVGVIAVDRDFSERDITDDDMQNLSLLANQAGLAIENSMLYEYIEHANTELSTTRERLIEAEKMAALGEMAAGMAHEIRNPLVSIGGFTRRLLKNMEEDSPQKVYVEVIINEVTRLEKTLRDILEFSTTTTLGQLEEHNINDIVSEALYVLRREFEDDYIEVVKDLAEVPPVLVDERQIKHVLFNLFYNACQAMEHGGGLRVKTYPTHVADRAFVAIEVSDTGKGIAPEVLPNIFNPFFTTKDTGTGLGLSIVHKIVSRHHGEIDVVNRAGEGATFIVKLPVSAEAGRYLK